MAGKKKRREEEQRNWADTRLEKKLKYTPSPSLCLVAIQFLRVSTREDIRPHGKPDPSSSPPSSPKVGPNLAAFLDSNIFLHHHRHVPPVGIKKETRYLIISSIA